MVNNKNAKEYLENHQKFKELILSFLEEGTLQHTIMAFWEYVLLLEICHKLILNDRKRHLVDHNLF